MSVSEIPNKVGEVHAETTLAGLVERCRRQDEAAIQELSRRYRERLKRYVESHMSTKGLAKTTSDDIVQEAFMVITQKLPELEFRGKQAFESWMLQICEGKIRDWIRHLGAAKRDVDREHSIADRDGANGDPMNLLASEDRTPSRHAYSDEKGRIVSSILGKLSDRHGKVLELRHMRGLTFAEIGGEMEITEDAAKALYGRAAIRFRSLAGRHQGVSDFTEFLD